MILMVTGDTATYARTHAASRVASGSSYQHICVNI